MRRAPSLLSAGVSGEELPHGVTVTGRETTAPGRLALGAFDIHETGGFPHRGDLGHVSFQTQWRRVLEVDKAPRRQELRLEAPGIDTTLGTPQEPGR
jgi:hypothetical protein